MSPFRVALIAPMPEEKWYSIELCAEMLLANLQAHHADSVRAEILAPHMVRRLSLLPYVGHRRHALNADRLLNRFWVYPRYLRQRALEFDLFHLAEHSYGQLARGLPAERTVVTCHDLDTFRCLLEPERDPRPRLYRAMAQQQMTALLTAARVICVSHTVRNELLGFGIVPAERVAVVPNGTHPSSSPHPNPPADDVAASFLASPRPTVDLLHVGGIAPRKRLDVLLRVFATVREEIPEARLIRVGGAFAPAHQELVKELHLEDSILVLPFLDREVLSAVYRRATLVLQPSDAEGFGLPVTEAMACGTPVVASDIPVLREVGGTVATYCPVGDVMAWSRAVLELLAERQEQPERWAARQVAGVSHGSMYSWEAHARGVLAIYQELLAA